MVTVKIPSPGQIAASLTETAASLATRVITSLNRVTEVHSRELEGSGHVATWWGGAPEYLVVAYTDRQGNSKIEYPCFPHSEAHGCRHYASRASHSYYLNREEGSPVVSLIAGGSLNGNPTILMGHADGTMSQGVFYADSDEVAHSQIQQRAATVEIKKVSGDLTLVEMKNAPVQINGQVLDISYSPPSIRFVVENPERPQQRELYQADLTVQRNLPQGLDELVLGNINKVDLPEETRIIAQGTLPTGEAIMFHEKIDSDGNCTISYSQRRFVSMVDIVDRYQSAPEMPTFTVEFVPTSYELTSKGTLIIKGEDEHGPTAIFWNPNVGEPLQIDASSTSSFCVPMTHNLNEELLLVHDKKGLWVQGMRNVEDGGFKSKVHSEPLTEHPVLAAFHLGDGIVAYIEDRGNNKVQLKTVNVWGLAENLGEAERKLKPL